MCSLLLYTLFLKFCKAFCQFQFPSKLLCSIRIQTPGLHYQPRTWARACVLKPQMKACGASTFWPRVARTWGKFRQEVVKAHKSVRLSLLSAVACQQKHLEPTIFMQHWNASWSFIWAGMFLDWKEKRMSPYWPLSDTFHEIWHDHINIMADLWHTRSSQLALLPCQSPLLSFHLFFLFFRWASRYVLLADMLHVSSRLQNVP